MYIFWVSCLYLYGTWGRFSTSAVMTLPSVSRDWLMFPASRARLSTAPERPMFSLPARSTWRREGYTGETFFSTCKRNWHLFHPSQVHLYSFSVGILSDSTVRIITRLSLPIFTSSSPSRVISFMWMVTENTEWERLHRDTRGKNGEQTKRKSDIKSCECYGNHPEVRSLSGGQFTWSRRSWAWTPSSSWLILSPGSDKLHLCCEPSPPPDPSPPRLAATHDTAVRTDDKQNDSTAELHVLYKLDEVLILPDGQTRHSDGLKRIIWLNKLTDKIQIRCVWKENWQKQKRSHIHIS